MTRPGSSQILTPAQDFSSPRRTLQIVAPAQAGVQCQYTVKYKVPNEGTFKHQIFCACNTSCFTTGPRPAPGRRVFSYPIPHTAFVAWVVLNRDNAYLTQKPE
jgi:hypothetical protein